MTTIKLHFSRTITYLWIDFSNELFIIMCSCFRPLLHNSEDYPHMAEITDLQTKVVWYNGHLNSWINQWSNPHCHVWLAEWHEKTDGMLKQLHSWEIEAADSWLDYNFSDWLHSRKIQLMRLKLVLESQSVIYAYFDIFLLWQNICNLLMLRNVS